MKIHELMDGFLAERVEVVAAATFARDQWLTEICINSVIGEEAADRITPGEVRRWATELVEAVAPSTAEAAIGLLRRGFGWGEPVGLVGKNPARDLPGRPWLVRPQREELSV